jgi:hypothetical protein
MTTLIVEQVRISTPTSQILVHDNLNILCQLQST